MMRRYIEKEDEKDDCPFWREYIKNVVKLSKEDFGAKKNLVYLVNTKPLWGDAYKDKKNKTKWLPFPGGKYPGKTKTEKKNQTAQILKDECVCPEGRV